MKKGFMFFLNLHSFQARMRLYRNFADRNQHTRAVLMENDYHLRDFLDVLKVFDK